MGKTFLFECGWTRTCVRQLIFLLCFKYFIPVPRNTKLTNECNIIGIFIHIPFSTFAKYPCAFDLVRISDGIVSPSDSVKGSAISLTVELNSWPPRRSGSLNASKKPVAVRQSDAVGRTVSCTIWWIMKQQHELLVPCVHLYDNKTSTYFKALLRGVHKH